jgi:ATP-dependent RNA helicase SUPV3L1/SUV3
VRVRLAAFAKGEIERRLAPLFALKEAPLTGAARGLVFQFVEALGCLPAGEVAEQVRALDPPTRRLLGRLGLRFGTDSVYLEPLLGVDAVRCRALLWAIREGRAVPRLPGAKGLGKAIPADPELPSSFYAAIGRRVIAGLAIRADRLERLAAAARGKARAGHFAVDAELAALAGIPPDTAPAVLAQLGFRIAAGKTESVVVAPPKRRPPPRPAPRRPQEGHPFAKLNELKFA